jgi:hypothetical protein
VEIPSGIAGVKPALGESRSFVNDGACVKQLSVLLVTLLLWTSETKLPSSPVAVAESEKRSPKDSTPKVQGAWL